MSHPRVSRNPTFDGGRSRYGARMYRIDELANRAGVTSRTVRAYQARGLLPPPELRGRTGYYSDEHLQRLRIIDELQQRGFSLAAIRQTLDTWARGGDLGHLLGFEHLLAAPLLDEEPQHTTLSALLQRFPEAADDPSLLQRSIELGLLELDEASAGAGPPADEAPAAEHAAAGTAPAAEHTAAGTAPAAEPAAAGTAPAGTAPAADDARVTIPSPMLLDAGEELGRSGVPLPVVLDLVAQLRGDAATIAERFVDLVTDHLLLPLATGGPDAPGPQDVVRSLERLRPIAVEVLRPFVARAVQEATARKLREHADVFETLASPDRTG
jgi:DNA-binding transcriptional MerR regulator